MPYLSYAALAQPTRFEQILENYSLAKEASLLSGKIVFLSHSTADDRHVHGVLRFFKRFKAPAYADDFDKRLPKPPTTATAVTLKDEIKKCPRFVVLVSPNSRLSRWIPWELGLADGFKNIPPIALLPVTPEGAEEAWANEEYFNLYPRIYCNGSSSVDDSWKVLDPRDNVAWKLSFWLHNNVS